MNSSIILSTAYLPPISWCTLAWNAEKIALEKHENYQKGTYRNRCHILGPNGLQKLSIPLTQGKHQQTPIHEVKIAYTEPWQKIHWRSIRAAYGRSPYFEHYAPFLMPFYEKQYEFLFDFNHELLLMVFKKLGFTSSFEFSETWQENYVSNPIDYRQAVQFDAAKQGNWFIPKHYSQVFEEKHGFVADLSILDLLFCSGKYSNGYLKI
jgi:WbqC-like protein family